MADDAEKFVLRLADCFEAEYAESGVDIDMDRAVKMLDEWREQQLQPLRARVSELGQAHAEQVAEREHLEAIYRSAKRALASHQFEKLEDAKRHIAALEVERARQAKGDKP